jgi:hypothetical protein
MAGRPGKKPQAATKPPVDEFVDESENFDDDVPALDADGNPVDKGGRSRDWRDVERYRELRELKKLVGEDLGGLFEDPGKAPAPAKRKR